MQHSTISKQDLNGERAEFLWTKSIILEVNDETLDWSNVLTHLKAIIDAPCIPSTTIISYNLLQIEPVQEKSQSNMINKEMFDF